MNAIKNISLGVLLALALFACSDKQPEEEKKSIEEKQAVSKSNEQIYAQSIENNHKKSNFLEEDMVSFTVEFDFGDQETQKISILSKTDLSQAVITFDDNSKLFYDGNALLLENEQKKNQKIAQQAMLMNTLYHSFFHLSEDEFSLSPREEITFFESDFTKMTVSNNAFHQEIYPQEFTFFTEKRTSLMKGLQAKFPYIGKQNNSTETYIQFDRFITVNRIPVSLQWNFFSAKKDASIGDKIGQAKVSRIQYHKVGEREISIPKDAKKVQASS
ncbi:MAG: hypothetical protein ACQESK_08770 [Bacteroidota bacterium]